MPNFHEHNEDDDIHEYLNEADEVRQEEESERDEDASVGSKHRPPVSAPARTSLETAQLYRERNTVKPHSVSSASNHRSGNRPSAAGSAAHDENVAPNYRPTDSAADSATSQTCPICSKSMMVDNRGFNAHIDFCLSRSAIREAQGEAAGHAQAVAKPSQKRLAWPDEGIGHKRTTSVKRKGDTR